MSSKNSPAWDLEQAMTAFQVNPIWYDEYWLRDTNDFTGPQVRRCAKRERHLAIKHAFFDLLATSIRFFRLAKATYPTTNVRFGSEADDDFLHPSHLATKKPGAEIGWAQVLSPAILFRIRAMEVTYAFSYPRPGGPPVRSSFCALRL